MFSFPSLSKESRSFIVARCLTPPQALPWQITHMWLDTSLFTCLRMNLTKTSLLLKNPAYLVHYSVASPRSDLAGFGVLQPLLVPRSSTLLLHHRSMETSLLASKVLVKSCRPYRNMRFCVWRIGGRRWAERGGFPLLQDTFFFSVPFSLG